MHEGLVAGVRNAFKATAQGILPRGVHPCCTCCHSCTQVQVTHHAIAARDILDRNNHRPVDHAELSLTVNGDDDLIIRVVRDSERPRIPTVELKPGA